MSKYQVIARRFRPQIFSDVVGQDPIITTLKNGLKFQKIGSGYLFCGTRGTGKTTLARLFAKALNCENLTSDYEPCNQCFSCQEIASGNSLNVLEIDGASNRGIDDIRQINETVSFAPSKGKYKIYIIDEVHMLTKEAFNALLKTLEEPPSHVKFFFATTEAHKVLPTILSRCQRFDLRPISLPLIQDKLRSIVLTLNGTIEEGALELIAKHSGGALRDAQSLLDRLLCYSEGPVTERDVVTALGIVPRDLFFELDRAIYASDLNFAFSLAERVYTAGNEATYFIEGFMEHIRILLEILLGAAPKDKESLHAATLYTKEQCLYLLDTLLHWYQEMGRIPFKRVGLEVILLRILRSRYRLSPEALTKRLMQLEGKVPDKWDDRPVEPVPPPTVRPPPPPPLTTDQKEEEPLPIKDSPLPFEKKIKEFPALSATQTPPPNHQLETLLRFAAVELEATYKKE